LDSVAAIYPGRAMCNVKIMLHTMRRDEYNFILPK
jgi:hypothetical protein